MCIVELIVLLYVEVLGECILLVVLVVVGDDVDDVVYCI